MRAPIRLGTSLYHLGIRLAATFNPKAREWERGREGLFQRIEARASALHGCLWMHCASVGEFEQGRPLLEAIKAERPDLPVLLTFFSPSGYAAFKDLPLATHVDYLPPDGASNAAKWIELLKPKAAIFVKYEFWYDHLIALNRNRVPTFLVSAIFRPAQPFFRWYGGAHRAMLRCFTTLFVQDEASGVLLRNAGIQNVVQSGDTRFDRVAIIAQENAVIPIAEAFRKASERPILIAGSTWPDDEVLITKALAGLKDPPRVMIAPHELGSAQLNAVVDRFPKPVARWSTLEADLRAITPAERAPEVPPDEDPLDARTLLVDRMGLLSRLYKYGDIAYVGGGFGSGIHSLLEAAAWGRPVIFGPRHQRFAEAKGLIDAGGGFEVKDAAELHAVLHELLIGPTALGTASLAARQYVERRTGATERVWDKIRTTI